MVRPKKRGRRSRIGTLAIGSRERTEVAAAKAIAEAGATARREAEVAAQEEIRAAYAAAVEAMVRAEVLAAEKVAVAEAAADEAVTMAQLTVAETEARAAAAEARAAAAELRAAAAEALARGQAVRTSAVAPADADQSKPTDSDRAQAEAEARARISQLVSRMAPVELWVHTTGRTVAEATEAALDQLGLDETEAEIEVLSLGSRWLPGKVQIRARVRTAGAAPS